MKAACEAWQVKSIQERVVGTIEEKVVGTIEERVVGMELMEVSEKRLHKVVGQMDHLASLVLKMRLVSLSLLLLEVHLRMVAERTRLLRIAASVGCILKWNPQGARLLNARVSGGYNLEWNFR
jgi:hypothetical protein